MSQTSHLSSLPFTRPSFFNLAALALILVLVGLGAAYWLDANGRPDPSTLSSQFKGPFVEKTLANRTLKLPASWQNPATHTNEKIVEVLDLTLVIAFTETSGLQNLNVHLASSNQSQPSALLLGNVYLLRFSPSQLNEVSGLIGKPLRQEEGFQSEIVWYDPIASNPFVAKCIDLGAKTNAPNCLRTVQLTPEVSATYQFSDEILPHWRTFDATVQNYLMQIFVD